MKICENCNTKTEDSSMFCPNCGSDKLNLVEAGKSDENTRVTATLSLIFGVVSCVLLLIMVLAPSLLILILSLILSIVAIICARLSIKGGIENRGKIYALVGRILGIISVLIVGVLFIIELIVAVSIMN